MASPGLKEMSIRFFPRKKVIVETPVQIFFPLFYQDTNGLVDSVLEKKLSVPVKLFKSGCLVIGGIELLTSKSRL